MTKSTKARGLAIAVAAFITLTVGGIVGYTVADNAHSHDTSAAAHAGSVVRPHYEEDDPQWNCQLDGDHDCGHVPACWTEHKPADPAPSDERLCGFADKAAPGSDGWVFGDFMHNTAIR